MIVRMGGPGSGGARQRSGPAPDPNALRRNKDGKEWTKLPAIGRLAPAPEWPDEVSEATPEELLMWRRVWTMPQALVWEADRVNDLVAFYVRTYLEAMKPHAGAMARTFAKQLADQLYLTPPALASGRYVVESTPEARAIDAALASVSALPAGRGGRRAARDRLGQGFPATHEPEDDDDDPQPETDIAAKEDPDGEVPF